MRALHRRRLAQASTAAVLAGMVMSVPGHASAAVAVTLYAAPSGSGAACTAAAPCSLSGAQSAVENLAPSSSGDAVTVDLLDGTYRLASTWTLSAADSGSAGHPVVWQAAPGARPVISGATQITGWSEVGTSGVWSAPVPSGSASRQVYVNGQEAPIAQESPAALGFAGGWTGTSTGYKISSDSAAVAWFGRLTAAQVAAVEFDYPGGNGAWTESRCRVASYAGGTLTMDQPCWADATARSSFSQGSGGLPSMSPSTMPALVEDAQALLDPGQWFLDSTSNTLYYEPSAGAQVSGLDVELPLLQQLVVGAGTLAAPLHDVTFQGLQFSYATWNAPSSSAGFADVQSNLRMTGSADQGMCQFSNPAGSCPWGSLTQPLANVAFSAAKDITLTGNRFADLGGAGLSVMYGSSNTLIHGNEFTDIASTGILLGCTADPNPTNPNSSTDPDTASVIKQSCTPNPSAVANDTIGTNEILTGTTVSNNAIHDVGTDYSSAPGITLLFSQNTTITHNDLYDLPYDGITAGVIQGHVDQASTPENSTNINQDNTISDNLFYNYLAVRSDGGAIYAEGHQAQYYNAGGTLLPDSSYAQADPTQTLAHGLQATGNVAYNGNGTDFTYYDDAGSEWINWQNDVAFNGGGAATGGCSSTGHFWITGGYYSAPVGQYACNAPIDTHASGNTTIPAGPGPADIPAGLLGNAGVSPAYAALNGIGPSVEYTSAVSSSNQVLIGGVGFTANTPVYVNGAQASSVQYPSSGFLIATVPAGTTNPEITVGNPVSMYRVNDTDPTISYSGFSSSANRTFGDLGNDVHYATANGSTATYSFTGTTIQVYGEQNTDQGNLGISIDGGVQQTVSTVPADGQRHADAVVYTVGGLSAGTHTIVITKLSGTYATLDGFGVPGVHVNDTDPSISYSGYSVSSGRPDGDFAGDVHYASANGSTATYSFTGSFIQVYGERYTDQGNIGVSIDGGAQQIVSTVPENWQRQGDAVVYSVGGLSSGTHTIVVTKLSGQYTTLDGFGVATTVVPPVNRINDTDSTITYTGGGWTYSANRGLGDYDNDVHATTENGDTATYTFTGSTIQVYGEEYTDEGNIGVSIDGGTQQVVNTVPSDGQRHSDVAVFTASGLSPGTHTIVITKLSGAYAVFDGFGMF
ncbi:hypothetical protein KDL01_31845 [Actinospica durhamensis]|uniref:Right handed beta helix region n=1 Tax=Actinospica durhamensis TaxID=1508375 RepID=A0A941EUI3_9ACTN|nr:hypothetical protein [Actinospica durhamensis]MBR7837910.1 hypothetical protein [Actinospica durhamensis]